MAPLCPESLYGGGNSPLVVWSDLDAIDRLIFSIEMEAGIDRRVIQPPPPPLTSSAPRHATGALTAVRNTGIVVVPQPGEGATAGMSSAPLQGFSGPVNQDQVVSADDHVSLHTLIPVYVSLRRADQLDARTVLDNPHLSAHTFAASAVWLSTQRTCTNVNQSAKSAKLKRFEVEAALWSVKTVGVDSQTRHVLITINVPVFAEVTGRSVISKMFARRRVNGVVKAGDTITIFQFWGCYWHGCSLCYHDRTTPVKNSAHETIETRYEATMACLEMFKNAGYTVVEMWECMFNAMKLTGKDLHQFVLLHEVYT
uniref:Uncharacterized protein n=1 Tax=Timema poppense TaxID=170557 RepID=A0A7R9DK71_TIMPO|nr:unnamed protein product [Timema poppensis]